MTTQKGTLSIEAIETTRYGKMPRPLQVIFVILTVFGILLAVYHLFSFSFLGQMLDVAYFFLLFAVFAGPIFLLLPAHRSQRNHVPWYDIVLAVIAFALPIFYFSNSWQIDRVGWVPPKTTWQFITALVFVLIALEGGRRMAGNVFLIVCLVIAIYPMVADFMPWLFWGKSFSIPWTITMFVYSPVGILGLPGQIMGNLLLGFLLFAGVLMSTGAGEFFLSLAIALLGRFRGGPAKVSVLASGFFGMLSGSVAANIVSTGCFTIPTMKRIGYPPHYAGAVEACSSTGGMLMPPIMGAVAFVMAAFLGIPYLTVCIAAVIPAILYYFGLLVAVDAYAAKTGLGGISKDELPSVKLVLKQGWPFVIVLLFLTWGLVYMRWEAMAPFYAVGLMIILSFTNKRTFLTPKRMVQMIVTVGRLLSQAMAVILPIGIIIAGLTATGSILSVTNAIVTLGQENTFLVLILGMVACYIMGMAGLLIPSYIFLAVTMAPAVIKAGGLNPVGVHLFIIYLSMLSMITLPVAAGAFIAGAMAGASPMRTAATAMRLGIVIYFIPFFFVYSPALILYGGDTNLIAQWPNLFKTLYLVLFCVIGISLIAGGLEGYIWKLGTIPLWSRPLIAIAGFLIGMPTLETSGAGAVFAAILIAVLIIVKKRRKPITAS